MPTEKRIAVLDDLRPAFIKHIRGKTSCQNIAVPIEIFGWLCASRGDAGRRSV